MIGLLTPDGAKTLFPRGLYTPTGKRGFAKISVLTADGDKIVFDKTTAIAGGLAVSASPDLVQGAVALPGIRPVTTNTTTASASGGSEPYTFAWALTDDDGGGGMWTALSPASATTQFRASGVEDSVGQSVATFTCTVTDARGATGTATVTAIAQNFGKI